MVGTHGLRPLDPPTTWSMSSSANVMSRRTTYGCCVDDCAPAEVALVRWTKGDGSWAGVG